jgi:hypothetical protein
MKNRFICIFIIVIGFSQSVISQIENSTDTTKTLIEKIKTEGQKAILDAGKSGDKSLVPYLKTLVNSASAQMALAKLGEDEYLNQILLETESSEINIQNFAIRKLAYVANKQAFRKLYKLLDNKKERGKKECEKEIRKVEETKSDTSKCGFCCDVMVFSMASEVVRVLSKTIESPPVKSSYGTDEDIQIWKKWFEENRELIE